VRRANPCGSQLPYRSQKYRHMGLKKKKEIIRIGGMHQVRPRQPCRRSYALFHIAEVEFVRTVIATVGTSLISNAKRDLGLEVPEQTDMLSYLNRVPAEKACAETNSLSRLLREHDRILLMCSETEEGYNCAQVLRKYYAGKGYDARVQEVKDLTYAEKRFKMRGLRSLVATLIDAICSERMAGREVVVNATGGFKAEIAYATLVGLLFDVRVYYIHDAFREIIEMPPAPISWDYSLLAEYDDFFEWLESELRTTEEVDRKLRYLPAEIRLLLAEEDGYTFLSPAGEAFYESYRDKLQRTPPAKVLLSHQAFETYNKADSAMQHEFKREIGKVCRLDLRAAAVDKLEGADCLVFPRGHKDVRVIFCQKRDGTIRVCEIARHSDKSYERIRQRGMNCQDDTAFRPWRENT